MLLLHSIALIAFAIPADLEKFKGEPMRITYPFILRP
jgi:hypothetical protein